jgi:hypothetical protein
VISGSGMMILKPTDTLLNSGLTTTIEQRNTTDSVWLAPHRVKNSNISKNLFPILCQHFKNLQCKLDSATIQKLTYIEVYDIISNIIYYDMSSIVHTQPGAHAYAVQKSRDSILLAY